MKKESDMTTINNYDTSVYDNFPVTILIYEAVKDADGKTVDYRIVYGNRQFAKDFRKIYGKDEFLGLQAGKNRLLDE